MYCLPLAIGHCVVCRKVFAINFAHKLSSKQCCGVSERKNKQKLYIYICVVCSLERSETSYARQIKWTIQNNIESYSSCLPTIFIWIYRYFLQRHTRCAAMLQCCTMWKWNKCCAYVGVQPSSPWSVVGWLVGWFCAHFHCMSSWRTFSLWGQIS